LTHSKNKQQTVKGVASLPCEIYYAVNEKPARERHLARSLAYKSSQCDGTIRYKSCMHALNYTEFYAFVN